MTRSAPYSKKGGSVGNSRKGKIRDTNQQLKSKVESSGNSHNTKSYRELQQQQQPPHQQHHPPPNMEPSHMTMPMTGMDPGGSPIETGPHHQATRIPSASNGVPPKEMEPEKKTRGRVRIRMEFISNKLRRYTTFSKRKTGIMKKAYELSTLTGTQVMLLVASETGHVYTFATPKLQPMITSETGKALIQTCLNSPDPPPPNRNPDERMSQTGYEETELNYPVPEEGESKGGNERGGYPAPDMNNSPPHSYSVTIPPTGFPMNMAFIPANKHTDNGYSVQQQFGGIFPGSPVTTYSNTIPPQSMAPQHQGPPPSHLIRISNSDNIDIASGGVVTTATSDESGVPFTIYAASPQQPPHHSPQNHVEETKHSIKQDSDSENRSGE